MTLLVKLTMIGLIYFKITEQNIIMKEVFSMWMYAAALMMIMLVACKTQEDVLEIEEVPKTETVVIDEKESIEEVGTEVMIIETMSEDADMSAPKASYAKAAPMMAMSRASASAGAPSTMQVAKNATDLNIESGQLTAGEWNDLHNWEDWNELMENTDYLEMQNHWGIYPNQRISVFVRNQYEFPIQDAVVLLKNRDAEIIWRARTDNSGKAELWPNLTTDDSNKDDYQIVVKHNGQEYLRGEVLSIADGVNSINIKEDCNSSDQVDVIFAVDATGSMGDEINYLQSELEDVITRISITNSDLKLRTGAVFYRDHTDDYLTVTKELSADHEATLSFIAKQTAQGGGDYPEAVDAALEEALNQEWSKKAVARIVFLLLDAPPHDDSLSLAKIRGQIALAAEKGVKIIPITASGINRQTEFLMKYLAMGTNGTYVFITDDSGIGNAHLDPVVQDYEVEKLNDLLVRLLNSYTSNKSCDIQKQKDDELSVKVFPNPTSNFITIANSKPIDRIKILSPSGKTLINREIKSDSDLKIDLSGMVDGMYTILIIGKDYTTTRPIVKIRS